MTRRPGNLWRLKLAAAIVFAVQYLAFLLVVVPDELAPSTFFTSAGVGTIAIVTMLVLVPTVLALAVVLLILSGARASWAPSFRSWKRNYCGYGVSCTFATSLGGLYGELGQNVNDALYGGGGLAWFAEGGCSVGLSPSGR
jgi:hypothetical protein